MLKSSAGRARRGAPLWLRAASFGGCALLIAGSVQAEPLTFEQALEASSDAPSLRASELGVDAARASAIAAGRLPDPRLRVGLSNYPVSGPSAGRFDESAMTMFQVGVQQDVPSRARRRAEREVAGADVDVARARAATTLWEVRIAAGQAWIDLHYAERRLAVLDELLASLEPLWEAAPAAVASSRLRPAQALGPAVGIDGKVVDPAAVTVIPSHDAGDRDAGILADQDLGVGRRARRGDVAMGIVPRDGQTAALPERNDGLDVGVPDRSEDDGHEAAPVSIGVSSRPPHSDQEPS